MSDASLESTAAGQVRRRRRWTRPVSSSLKVTALLGILFAVYTVLVIAWSPMEQFDVFLNRNYHVHWAWPVLHVLDRVGQRAVCLPILAVVTAVFCWRHRSVRPATVVLVGVVAINLVMLILKLWLGRGRPVELDPDFFAGGEEYPSGHTANIIVVYGLGFHLLAHYGVVSLRLRRVLISLIGLLGVVMFVTSLLLRWHWFSDLVGGYLVGGAVLALTVGVDAAVPFRSRRLVVLPPPEPAVVPEPPPPGRSGPPQAAAAAAPDAAVARDTAPGS
jgi:membrane-associated phospholipid phosphatase